MAISVSRVATDKPPMMAIARGGHSNEGESVRGRNPAIVVAVVMTICRERSIVTATTNSLIGWPAARRASKPSTRIKASLITIPNNIIIPMMAMKFSGQPVTNRPNITPASDNGTRHRIIRLISKGAELGD